MSYVNIQFTKNKFNDIYSDVFINTHKPTSQCGISTL